MTKNDIDYSKIDPNIQNLVRVLNSFEGVRTTESCGGHEDNKPYQLPAGELFVSLEIDLTNEWAIQNLQFLGWAINSEYRQNVILRIMGSPEGFGEPALTLYLDGEGDPDDLADFLEKCRELFTEPEEGETDEE